MKYPSRRYRRATPVVPEMSEKDFTQAVYDRARVYGWLAYHTWRSIHSAPGFPDLVMVRGDRLIFAELKSAKGKETPAQRQWLDVLGRSDTCEVYTWRPEHWETIVKILE